MILNFNPTLLVRDSSTYKSTYCYIVRNLEVQEKLQEVYGRPNLCLKIFKDPLGARTIYTFGWGKKPLGEVSKIQNLFARRGIAPRVFDLVEVNGHAAQVTNFVEDDGQKPNVKRLTKLMGEYQVSSRKGFDVGERNWVGSQFVDFSGFHFQDLDEYINGLGERAHTRRGENIDTAYQEVDLLGIKGTRDFSLRSDVMKLDKIDFKDKTVLDIGCNLGAFCRAAQYKEARRVVGIDRIANLSFEINNWLGYFNLDFIKARLPADVEQIKIQSGIEKFDIVFCLAAIKHVGGWGEWIKDLCADLFIFEGHGNIPKDIYWRVLEENFRQVNYLGQTEDNYSRVVYQCRR